MKTQSVLFAQIAKVDEAQRLVHGRAAQEILDRSGEIFDYDSSKGHFADWSKTTKDATNGASVGNLRAMHGKVAAGKLTDITFNDDEKAIDIVAKVVDDQEWNKILEGVYTGFSIGGEYARKWDDKEAGGKRYTAIPSEISLVDRPCGPTSTFFKMMKADGSEVEVEFKKSEDEEKPTPDEEEAPTDEAKDIPEEKAEEEKEAEKADYVVDGTDEDVERLSKFMVDSHLNVGQVVKGLEGLAKAIGSDQLAKALTQESTFAPLVKSTFADPENYKFPLDTADQVKAAWNFLNKDSAKASYEPEQFAKMMEKVKKAWKDKLGTEPDDNVLVVKVANEGTLCKGLFDVHQLSDVLMGIRFVLANSVWQEKNENAPAHSVKLMAAFEAIAEVINDMIAEEIASFTESEQPSEVMALSDNAKGLLKSLEKIGARNSKSDAEKIQVMHDHSVSLGATCSAAEKTDNGSLAKSDGDQLSKAMGLVDDLTKTVGTLTERLQKLEAQPAPAKAVLKVVSKAQDVIDEPAAKAVEVVDSKGEANPVASLIKSVHQSGGQSLEKI